MVLQLQCCTFHSQSLHTHSFISTLRHRKSLTHYNVITSQRNRKRKSSHSNSKFTCFVNIGLDDIAQLAHNKVVVAAGVSAVIGQLSKPFTSVILYGKDFNFRTAFQAGGFPSTHSSSVVATATCLALERGFSDSIFGLSLVYAGLVMYDAQGVRREVGNHAKALHTLLPKRQVNSVVSKFRDNSIDSREVSTKKSGNVTLLVPSDKQARQSNGAVVCSELAAESNEGSDTNAKYVLIPLKESIGHTEVEVVAGAVLGLVVSLAVYSMM